MLPLFLLPLLVVGVSAGTINQRIINGNAVIPHSYPSQLSLRLNGYHICGAVLIHERFAITAAHCIGSIYQDAMNNFTVACGAHNIKIYEPHTQILDVDLVVKHAGFRQEGIPSFVNDIAMLRLKPHAEMTHECQLATLPQQTQNFTHQQAIITGWGHTGVEYASQLKEGRVTVLSEAECAAKWSSTVHSQFHICVQDPYGKHASCNADSGGPAYVNRVVVGLTSFGAAGCPVSYPTVYTRLTNYIYWIYETMNMMHLQ